MPTYTDLQKLITQAVNRFDKSIPTIQKGILQEVMLQLKGLDLQGEMIRPTIGNMNILNRVKNRLLKVVLTDDYLDAAKEYMGVFGEVTKTANEIFKGAELKKSTRKLLKIIKNQSIADTVASLTDAGIGANIGEKITAILRANITAGSSYKSLTSQLNELLTDTETPGAFRKHTRQITSDAVNQYTASFMQNVSGDLGYEWYRYQGKDIDTSRPFCRAMRERGFFHVSEIPGLLKGKDLHYTEDGQEKKVEIYAKTGLPHGMIEGTDASNFFVRRGGYGCGDQVFPVAELIVPEEVKKRVYSTPAYLRWKTAKEPGGAQQERQRVAATG